MAFDAEGKAQAFADSLETNDHTHEHRRTRREVRDFLSVPPTHEIRLTKPLEIKKTLKHIHNDKVPSPDNITVNTLKQMPKKGFTHLTKISNTSLRLNHFPEPFRKAHVIMIPKPGKDPLFPQNHRSISLLDHAGKVLERIILSRLQTHTQNVITETQFAYKSEYSTTIQLLRIIDYIITGFLNREHTTAVFFDIENALDSVWHMGLVKKLITANLPDVYIQLQHSFLRNRLYRVRYDKQLTNWCPMNAGVSQGSVLAPTPYCIYMSDIPKHAHTEIAQYADDTAIYTTHKDIHTKPHTKTYTLTREEYNRTLTNSQPGSPSGE